ncbi:L,D-transpeptidase family protein [Flexibacterium corallicola]|uniref:L,D-transpeptidase family protein n=1 Tax=Flexibacterium corallicola TaxID=3037259 RepID=UPI00286F4525|nr:L,D-transpeptidase family protein [Pseudovibrio sp. M1P-2-3]
MSGHKFTRAIISFTCLLFLGQGQKVQAAIPEKTPQIYKEQHVLLRYSIAHEIKRALLNNSKSISFRAKRDRAALELFYEERGFQPIWVRNGKLNKVALTVISKLLAAAEEGLSPSDYPTPEKSLNSMGQLSSKELAHAEISLTLSVLRYAEDAQAGRISPRRISKNIAQKPHRPDPVDALQKLSRSPQPDIILGAFNPPHQGYKDLKIQLEKLRSGSHKPKRTIEVPTGPLLKLGMSGLRVSLLKKRLNVPSLPDTQEMFDADLKKAVQSFQRENGLHEDGVVGARTLLSLNKHTVGNPIYDIIANMERWRWLPRELGDLHLTVNIPEFMVRLKQENKVLYKERVVVGKRSHQTPVFSDNMRHIIVNPYWNVPYSIASKELLPEIAVNPRTYFAKGNYEVLSKGRVIDPKRVNWTKNPFKKLRIRQRPGRGNALGKIKFMFPNKHNVYLHDTPSKSLFNRSERAFSHGCVRVRNPLEFADALMEFQSNRSGKYLRNLIGKKETQVNLETKFPIHLTYFTSFVDEKGKLQRRPDIYGHNEKTIRILGLN